jgi:glutamate dehydrogenase (NAD(P)+)
VVSSLGDSDVFTRACRRCDQADDAISLPRSDSRPHPLSRRCRAGSLPVTREAGSVTVFDGYRVQPKLSTSPAQGGLRFHEHVTLGKRQYLARPRYLQEMVCCAPRAG